MGKRKEIKDNDVEMGGTDPRVDGDESDEVNHLRMHRDFFFLANTDDGRRTWTL